MLSGEIDPISNAKKKGMERRMLKRDTKKENSNAEREKSTFFCEIAEAAESTAEIRAIKNQFIILPIDLNL
jgi:hypothetical protein